jgi:hypothetical protein
LRVHDRLNVSAVGFRAELRLYKLASAQLALRRISTRLIERFGVN